jgi:hypothetical protein
MHSSIVVVRATYDVRDDDVILGRTVQLYRFRFEHRVPGGKALGEKKRYEIIHTHAPSSLCVCLPEASWRQKADACHDEGDTTAVDGSHLDLLSHSSSTFRGKSNFAR